MASGRRWRVSGALVCLLLSAVAWTSRADPARVEWPARNLISLQEGTIEAWVRLGFDPAQPEETVWRAAGSLFAFQIPAQSADRGGGLTITFGLRSLGKAYALSKQSS